MQLPTSSELDALREAIRRIDQSLEKHRTSLQAARLQVGATKTGIMKSFIYDEFAEFSIICSMLLHDFDGLYKFTANILNAREGVIASDHIAQFQIYTRQVPVELKAMYEWLYHIKNLLEGDKKNGTSLEHLLEPSTLLRLETHVRFRHKLITHKTKAELCLVTDPTWTSRDYRLFVVDKKMPQSAIAKVNRWFQKVKRYFAPVDANETNPFRQLVIMMSKLDAIPHEGLRDETVGVIGKYGSGSETATGLAQFAATLAGELLPPLSGLS